MVHGISYFRYPILQTLRKRLQAFIQDTAGDLYYNVPAFPPLFFLPHPLGMGKRSERKKGLTIVSLLPSGFVSSLLLPGLVSSGRKWTVSVCDATGATELSPSPKGWPIAKGLIRNARDSFITATFKNQRHETETE
ncbi:hypothetical protein CEXT_192611 [Caerostris extrusa]|uniref:Uncharacterized protein n=1 Tax=Caerostris extrusa TaxID=172846 RepID=A0AAV4V350_CAEEX|nr:hypothetical protein CEXT_192611 [Caerostris extrusa]